MILELKAAIALVGELPETEQRALATMISLSIESHVEKQTMTKREIAALRRLEKKKRLERHNRIRKYAGLPPLKKWF